MIQQNIRAFQESITKELQLIKDRVRDLIGDANWAEDGRYKEAILSRAISQFLPSNLKIGTGFIVGNEDYLYGSLSKTSSQLDLIIYDDKTPIIFREGDFVILTETSVRAVIEVKSRLINYSTKSENAINKVLEKLNRLKEFRSFHHGLQHRKMFVGVFSFDYSGDLTSSRVEDALKESNGLINHISLGPHKFIKYWESTEGLHLPVEGNNGRGYMRYHLESLSFSYFISNLLHIVADEEPVERSWFSFPIQGTKEIFREGGFVRLDI